MKMEDVVLSIMVEMAMIASKNGRRSDSEYKGF